MFEKEFSESMKRHMKGYILTLMLGLLFLLSCGKSQSAQLEECLDFGQKYMAELNYEEAIIAYNKALEIDPKNVDAYQALVNIYEFKEDIDQAKSTLERALAAIPSNAEFQARYERLMQTLSSDSTVTVGESEQNTFQDSRPSVSKGSPTEVIPESSEVLTLESIKEDGWVQMNGKWYFYVEGEKATGWMQQGKNWFYFDEEGVLQNGKTKIENEWYYFNEDGAMVTGWQEENGKWYYFELDGTMLTDQWIEDTYYVGPDGAMVVSTTTPDGQEVDEKGRKIVPYGVNVTTALEGRYVYKYSDSFGEIFIDNGNLNDVASVKNLGNGRISVDQGGATYIFQGREDNSILNYHNLNDDGWQGANFSTNTMRLIGGDTVYIYELQEESFASTQNQKLSREQAETAFTKYWNNTYGDSPGFNYWSIESITDDEMIIKERWPTGFFGEAVINLYSGECIESGPYTSPGVSDPELPVQTAVLFNAWDY